MALGPGSTIGPYEISGLIGAGGMGEVYRARDTNLKRLVAIKVLPESLASEPDRLARFQREAELLASLNHPNIAQIHGLERSGGTTALILELVDGPTLADRIALGAIPLDEALAIARQIADALDTAHERGIVHRDLKPANIKLRDDGTVKVLDFGLAKALATDATEANLSHSPTLSLAATRAGVILGTAAYMSPEQARGKPMDKRTDVWAFGCVLYEMLTGRRAFDGEAITDVIAAVMRGEPDWSRLPADTPWSIRRVLRRTLEKDRKQRIADIADVRLDLDDKQVEPVPAPDRSRAAWRERMWAAVAVVATLAAVVLAWRAATTANPAPRIVRFQISPPAGTRIDWGRPISPDGRTVAFAAIAPEGAAIWVHPLESATARMLPGTERAVRTFWSPDSQQIAFFVDGNLKRVALDGSPPRLVANGPFRDGAWSSAGIILLGGQQGRPLMRVSELGGEPVAETTLDPSQGEVSHDYPEFLPDGRHYIYLVRSTKPAEEWVSYLGTLGAKERQPLPGIRASVHYSPTGHLLFLRGTALVAQRFDSTKLQLVGDAFPVAQNALGGRAATFSISSNGTLAFISGELDWQLAWFDRSGRMLSRVGPTAIYNNFSLSADARSIVFDRGVPADLFVMDVTKTSALRVTSGPSANRQPLWSPDGRAVVWVSNRNGTDGVYQRTLGAAAAADRLIFTRDTPITLSDWSRDGRYLAYATAGDIWVHPVDGSGDAVRITSTPFLQEAAAAFSPDGRWIAFQSDESSGVTRSGDGDIFVESFPDKNVKVQATTGGGLNVRWNRDGKELYYLAPDGTVMAIAVNARPGGIEFGTPTSLFRPRFGQPFSARYAVAGDGRFLVRTPETEGEITVVLNWVDELKRMAPN